MNSILTQLILTNMVQGQQERKVQLTIESTCCLHLSVNKYVHGDSVVHSMSLGALSSQQIFFGRDVGPINSQAVAEIW